MFTGIIETLGEIKEVKHEGSNIHFLIQSSISDELRIDQSISHNGVCLTVIEKQPGSHRITAIQETLNKTCLPSWKAGDLINLERCLAIGDRLDGHIVQGHVDTTAICAKKVPRNGSWEYLFEFPKQFSNLVIEKGSISLNGISLTIFEVKRKSFTVAIIPYTFEHTNMKMVQPGIKVNIEFDVIGKYILRSQEKT